MSQLTFTFFRFKKKTDLRRQKVAENRATGDNTEEEYKYIGVENEEDNVKDIEDMKEDQGERM